VPGFSLKRQQGEGGDAMLSDAETDRLREELLKSGAEPPDGRDAPENFALVATLTPGKLTAAGNDQLHFAQATLCQVLVGASGPGFYSDLSTYHHNDFVAFLASQHEEIAYIWLVSREDWAGKGYYVLEIFTSYGDGSAMLVDDAGQVLDEVIFADLAHESSLVSDIITLERAPGDPATTLRLFLRAGVAHAQSRGQIQEIRVYQVLY
jgi:hypothetical protein